MLQSPLTMGLCMRAGIVLCTALFDFIILWLMALLCMRYTGDDGAEVIDLDMVGYLIM